jgi:cation:H+ antiporter
VQKQGQRSRDPKEQQSLVLTVTIFLGAAAATLVAGFFLEQSGDAASVQIGLSGILFGATVLALATSLPEISVGLQSIRQGDENLAISDIFGGNAFLPVLFLVAGLISGDAVLPQAGSADVYLTAIAALLTAVYAFGLLFRPKRRVLGMGIDSVAVVILYLIGIGGLFAISR